MFVHTQRQQVLNNRRVFRAERLRRVGRVVVDGVKGALCGVFLLSPLWLSGMGWITD